MFQENFKIISISCQDMKPTMGSARSNQTAANPADANRGNAMAQESTTAPKAHNAGISSPKCLMTWTIDRRTGKPVARWAAEQLEKTAALAIRPAA